VEDKFVMIASGDRKDYRELISQVSESVWPEFMFHDPIAIEYWDGLFEDFPLFQRAALSREGGDVAGILNSVPLFWDGDLEDLPDEGWDWAIKQSVSDRIQHLTPNLLCGLQISIHPDFQGRGLSKLILETLVGMAHEQRFPGVIVPVRPSMKDRYPLTPIDAYIQWKTDEGLPYDPWLRVHVRNGGRIIKVCPFAMEIVATVSEWEQWTQLRFFESGEYVIPGALVPVEISIERDQGSYIEPNVWVVHPVELA
jgi:GNAT superfamily N-acetyltransferase